jgi:hypothetical protein
MKNKNAMTPETEQPYISEEEAERRTKREALLIITGGFCFLCAPTLLCYPQYRQFTFFVILIAVVLLSSLWTLIIFLQTADLLTRLGLRKRKERFLSAEELEAAKQAKAR